MKNLLQNPTKLFMLNGTTLVAILGVIVVIVPYHIVSDWIRIGLAEEKEKGYAFFIRLKESK